MTVESTTRRATYTGDGVATEFDFDFPIRESTDLVVQLLTIATGVYETLDPSTYSATGIGADSTGGTVTYPLSGSPLPATKKIIILRVVNYKQEVDIYNQGGFFPEVTEYALDKLAMGLQQIAEDVGRSFKSLYGQSGLSIDITNFDVGTIFMYGENGTVVPGPTADNVAAAQGYADRAEAARDIAEAAAASIDTKVVGTRTALKEIDTNATETAVLSEDAGKMHGRFGRFFVGLYSDWAAIEAVDTLEGYVIRSTFDDTKVWVRDCETLIPQHFGATASGNGNDAPALNCFYNVCITARKAGRIPASETTYYCTEQVFWDMSQRTSGAPDILGDSAYGACIHFQNGVASPNMKISGPDAFAIFYHRFGNFSVTGNTTGIVLQIGEDDFSDALNGCIVEYMRVGNANQTSGAIACRLNWLLRSKIVIGANSATSAYAGTVAMNCRRLQACELWGAVGNTDIGILFDMNNQYGNTFHGFDYETLRTAIKITESIRDNTFAGGMAAINDAFIDATAGTNNIIDAVNFAASVTEIIKNQDATDATWGGVGVSIINKREANLHSFPALSTVGSGGWTRNAGGQPVLVSLFGGTVSSVYIRRVPSAGSGNRIASATGCQFLVQPGEEWQVNYTGLPNQNVRVAG